MSQVSKFQLRPSVQQEIIKSFFWLIAHLTKEDEVEIFLGDFLTKTEKLILAKRFAIALMIENGYSYPEIRDTLKVSTSTIVRIHQLLDASGKGYRLAIRKLSEKKQLETFWRDIGKVIELIGKGKRVLA